MQPEVPHEPGYIRVSGWAESELTRLEDEIARMQRLQKIALGVVGHKIDDRAFQMLIVFGHDFVEFAVEDTPDLRFEREIGEHPVIARLERLIDVPGA